MGKNTAVFAEKYRKTVKTLKKMQLTLFKR